MIPIVSRTVKGIGDGGVTYLDWSATALIAALTEVAKRERLRDRILISLRSVSL